MSELCQLWLKVFRHDESAQLLLKGGAVIGRSNNILLKVNVALAIQAWLRTPERAIVQFKAILKNVTYRRTVDGNAGRDIAGLKIDGNQPASAVTEEIRCIEPSF